MAHSVIIITGMATIVYGNYAECLVMCEVLLLIQKVVR